MDAEQGKLGDRNGGLLAGTWTFGLSRVKQLEEENDYIANSMCRLKSQTEKLDEVCALPLHLF